MIPNKPHPLTGMETTVFQRSQLSGTAWRAKAEETLESIRNFLGAWLIALISQPVTIKTSGMDGNNARMGPKIRYEQRSAGPSGWALLSEAGPGAGEEKFAGRDQRRTSAD